MKHGPKMTIIRGEICADDIRKEQCVVRLWCPQDPYFQTIDLCMGDTLSLHTRPGFEPGCFLMVHNQGTFKNADFLVWGMETVHDIIFHHLPVLDAKLILEALAA